MAEYIKKKIVEKLAKFTKDLKPSDISLSFLRGKGRLKNLALDEGVIQEVLRLPPWISIDKVHCDEIAVDVPFTDLNKSPIKCMLNKVSIIVSTCSEEEKLRKTVELNLTKLSSSSSSYGLIDKVIDGMKLEIRTIDVQFNNPVFNAKLEMTEVVIASTTPQWEESVLSNCRYKNEEEGSIVIYKKCTWSCLKIEGCGPETESEVLRLITNPMEIRAVLKRRLNDCKVLHTRVSVSLGDLVWVLMLEHLRTLSKLAQSLVEAAVNWNRKERMEFEKWRGSQDSIDSLDSVTSGGSGNSGRGGQKEEEKRHRIKRSHSPRKDEKEIVRERKAQTNVALYQLGHKNLPSHEIIQDSIHIKTGNVDLQLCDETGSLLLQLKKLLVDIYLDQEAGSGRCHWNKANLRLSENMEWSANLVRAAEKIQHVNLSSINMYKLKERGIVIRCADYKVRSVGEDNLLPILSCDKQTFSLPDDVDNPAFQCGLTMYYYPSELGNRFLVPRPNVSIYLSPLHINFHQEPCMWLVEFVHSLARTVNLSLLLSAHTEGQILIEQFKAKKEEVQQLPGLDVKFYIPYSKVTLPVPSNYNDGRPRALQIETGGIYVENHTLMSLLSNPDFLSAWDKVKRGWLVTSSGQFPHDATDPSPIPGILKDLIDQEIRAQANPSAPGAGLSGTRSSSSLYVPPSPKAGRRSNPDITSHKGRLSTHQLKLLALECWCIHTRCITLSFVKDLSHEATLYTSEFVQDFPLQLWLFQTAKMVELLDPSSSTQSVPHLHILAKLSESISIQLEHLQFLFLMRLKDAFQGFKNRIMKLLTIESLLESQDMFQLREEREELVVGDNVGEEKELKEKLASVFKSDDNQSGQPQTNSEMNQVLLTAAVCGEGVSVFVKLPSLMERSPPKLPLTNTSLSSKEPSPLITVSSPPPTSLEPVHQQETHPPNGTNDPALHVSTDHSSPANGSDDFILIDQPTLETHPPTETHLSVSHDSLREGSCDLHSPVASIATAESDDVPIVTEFITEKRSEVSIACIELADTISTNTEGSNMGVVPGSPQGAPPPSSLKSPTSILSYTPVHILYIGMGTVRALLHIKEEGIIARATVGSLDLAELTDKEAEDKKVRYSHRQKQANKEVGPDTPTSQLPAIKARMEMGDKVERYFSDPAILVKPDMVIMLKVSGLKTALYMKNLLVLKDFFEDEVEADNPDPLQLRIMETQVCIKDEFLAPPTHPRNITISIPDLFINRGPRAEGTNLVLHEASAPATEGEEMVPKEISLEVPNTDQVLLESFQHFIDAFQAHVAGRSNISVSQPDKISHLLKELELAISTPPPYNEAVTCDFYSNVNSVSPHPTVDTLQAEIENLRLENQQLKYDLSVVNEEKTSACEERDNVISELVDTKVKLASCHLVLEQNLQKIENLFNENSVLKEKVEGALGNSTIN